MEIYLTQRQQLKHLTVKEYKAIKELCFLAKNMYNVAVYNIRQHFFDTGEYLNYIKNYPVCKDNENYKLLNSNMGQQIIKEADGAFKSFFGLLRLKKKGNYDAKVKIPHYLPKEGYFTLIIGQIRIKDNMTLDIPMSPCFRRLYGKVTIKLPSNLKDRDIKEIRIIPKFNGRFFEVQYIYKKEILQRELNKENVLSVDFGVNNLATCVTNNGKSFIIDGKKLKSINQYYNKQCSKYQSICDKVLGSQRKILTNRVIKITLKRNNRVRDYLNKSARLIVDYCLNNDIGTLVVGYNKGLKKNSNIGSINNQSFVQIPITELTNKLRYLSKYNNVKFVEQEESYTSKSDFFNNDKIPVYGEEEAKYSFSGKRISRGQYKSVIGKIINADLNGALNIMLKSKLGGSKLKVLQLNGNLDMPIRIRVS